MVQSKLLIMSFFMMKITRRWTMLARQLSDVTSATAECNFCPRTTKKETLLRP
jgi:hypothetical protein